MRAGPDRNVTPGLEVCIASPPGFLEQGARFGLLTNQAAVDREFRPAPEVLAARWPGQLAVLFSPQHGLWGEQQDNMIETPHSRHPVLDVPVYSLYSETRRPAPRMLDGLDWLLVDLQDVGCRVYTFLWTVTACLEVCAQRGIGVLVLDRPNPLGGTRIEGPRLGSAFRSFVGMASLPLRHDLTLGEATRFVNRALGIGADVHVCPLQNWSREMRFRDTGLPWVPPSPNLPRIDGVFAYPGQVLLEGTNLSEGRGTTTPFEICGAPFIEPFRWRDAVAEFALPGVRFRPVRFEPTFGKWAGQSCGGLFLHVTDPEDFEPVRTTLVLLLCAKRLWPRQVRWRPPPYEYETERPPIDILAGGPAVRELIDRAPAAIPEDVARVCAVDVALWRRKTADARLYGLM
ncbi:MAG: DUF1343 domain-containing protein [Kiritimatiellaeota bacterium]|nr:DUF1343 domain-containing protein [Kiritimatiellota bacterium]